MRLWPSSETSVWTAVGMVPVWFLLIAPGRAPDHVRHPSGGLLSRRRTEMALRSGVVPDGIDRDVWISYLSLLPNTSLLRRRTRWVLAAGGALLLVGACAVGAAVVLEIGDPLAIAEPFVLAQIGVVVGVVLALMLPAIWIRTVDKMLRPLRSTP